MAYQKPDGLIAQSVRASERKSAIVGSNPTLATSKNPSVVNTICISSFYNIHVITCVKFRLKLT